jgi:hypothetical protein
MTRCSPGTRMRGNPSSPAWLHKLDTQLTDWRRFDRRLRWPPHLGTQFPFPVARSGSDASFANIFVPERAKHLWAVARKEYRAGNRAR